MKLVERIDVDRDTEFSSYVEYQSLYLDRERRRLKPNTKIFVEDRLYIEINSLGCKGPDLQPELPVMAFLGCSVTFGQSSWETPSWTNLINIAPYQVLNAGIEGANLQMMVERFQEIGAALPLDVLVVYPGWHNLIYGERGSQFWKSHLDQLRGRKHTAIIIPSTCLTEELASRGIESLLSSEDSSDRMRPFQHLFTEVDQSYFYFWADLPSDLESVRKIYYAHQDFCAFLRYYCESSGLQYIDLDKEMKPRSFTEVPSNHFDIVHLRHQAYPRVARFVQKSLSEAIGTEATSTPQTPHQIV